MIPTVILDTSVLISGLRSSLGASFVILQHVGKGRFTLGLSVALLLEYEAICTRSFPVLGLTAEDIRSLLDYFCKDAKLSGIPFRVRPSVDDPDDELVLEAAIATGADWMVTHNVRDMELGAARYGIEVIRPGEALRRLGV
jgi:predicted nucleic acid-binding protein